MRVDTLDRADAFFPLRPRPHRAGHSTPSTNQALRGPRCIWGLDQRRVGALSQRSANPNYIANLEIRACYAPHRGFRRVAGPCGWLRCLVDRPPAEAAIDKRLDPDSNLRAPHTLAQIWGLLEWPV